MDEGIGSQLDKITIRSILALIVLLKNLNYTASDISCNIYSN